MRARPLVTQWPDGTETCARDEARASRTSTPKFAFRPAKASVQRATPVAIGALQLARDVGAGLGRALLEPERKPRAAWLGVTRAAPPVRGRAGIPIRSRSSNRSRSGVIKVDATKGATVTCTEPVSRPVLHSHAAQACGVTSRAPVCPGRRSLVRVFAATRVVGLAASGLRWALGLRAGAGEGWVDAGPVHACWGRGWGSLAGRSARRGCFVGRLG